MLDIVENQIYLTRGDTAYLTVALVDASGNNYRPVAGDKIYFRLKKNIFGDSVIFEKEVDISTLKLNLAPSDTKNLDFTSYRYEIELVKMTGECFTVVENELFVVGVEVSEREIIKGYIQASFDPLSTDVPIYQGEYEFSPSASQQTIPTRGKALENDIVINANPYDSNTADATANAGEILTGKTAYVNKQKLTGTMPNRGAVNQKISSISEPYTIPEGYHNGEGVVSINTTGISAENIKSGTEVLGIQGEMPNRGAVSGEISTASGSYSIQNGYHNGEGTVQIKNSERTKIIPSNIKSGIEILGVAGSFTSDANATTSQLLDGQTAYVNGSKITGTMSNQGAVKVITTVLAVFQFQAQNKKKLSLKILNQVLKF